MLFEVQAQLLFCTPTYALHLAEVAREQALSLRDSSVRSIVVAGEPGGSVPGVRRQIEDAWGARIVDHAGATEVGPWGLADRAGHGLHVIEAEFLAEWLPWSPSDGVHVLPPASGRSDVPPPTHELVITALGRYGMPAIRYRTGDLAAPQADLLTDSVTPANAQEPCGFVFLPGGILGRVDEMLTVRGVNVFPQAIDAILRRYAPWAEYRIVLQRHQALDQLLIQVEAQPATAAELALALSSELGLRLHVESLASGSLPRFEGKARRVIDQRSSA
jgi:phenylacetate-CoA ligase